MGTFGTWLLIIFGAAIMALIILAALAVYGYRRLAISFASIRVTPELQMTGGAIIGALVNMLTRNFAAAAGGFIKGARLDGKLTCANRSRVRLYLPATEHEVLVEGKPCPKTIRIAAFWL